MNTTPTKAKFQPSTDEVAIVSKLVAEEEKKHKKLPKGWHVVRDLVSVNKKTKEPKWTYYVVYFEKKGYMYEDSTIRVHDYREDLCRILAQNLNNVVAVPEFL